MSRALSYSDNLNSMLLCPVDDLIFADRPKQNGISGHIRSRPAPATLLRLLLQTRTHCGRINRLAPIKAAKTTS